MSEAEEQAWQKHKTVWPLEAGVEPMNHEFAFRMGYRAGQAVSLPDRETLAKVALKTYNEWANLSPLKQMSFGYPSLGELIADAVLVALSTQPAAGEVEPITDEQVNAAGRVMYPGWDRWFDDDPQAFGERELMRTALEAAMGVDRG